MNIKTRQKIEREIATMAVNGLLEAGYTISVSDGDRLTPQLTDPQTIEAAMFAADEDILYVYRDGKAAGYVHLVYGNDGWDVICDNTINLDPALLRAEHRAANIAFEHSC